MSRWTKEDIRELKKRFPNADTHELADEMARPYEALKKQASRLGLHKSRRYLKALGRKP